MRLFKMLNYVLKKQDTDSTKTFVSKKFINKKNHSMFQRLLNFKSKLETVTNFKSWKSKLTIQIIDWIGTCALFILAVLFVASSHRVLLAIGLFVTTELVLAYFREVVRVVKQ